MDWLTFRLDFLNKSVAIVTPGIRHTMRSFHLSDPSKYHAFSTFHKFISKFFRNVFSRKQMLQLDQTLFFSPDIAIFIVYKNITQFVPEW